MSREKVITMEEAIHSINEQLQIMRSSVEHLVMLLDTSEEEKEYLDKIVDAIDKCSDIVNSHKVISGNLKTDVSVGSILKRKGAKILIIEDEPSIAEIYSSNLEYFGFKTLIANNFIDGMDIINKEDIDIVILDVILPDAYGLDCVDTILAKNKDIKIVVTTGKIDELKQDLSHLEGKCTILTKPFSIRALLAAVL